MSPLAKRTFGSAMRRLELASAMLEDAAESGIATMIGDAYGEVLLARGEFAAGFQILELENTIKTADERPVSTSPPLRIVR